MQLRNKLAIVTAAASLAFVGTGFAAWVFQNQVASTSVDGVPQITCAVELNQDFKLYKAGETTALEHLYLICDAPATGGADIVMPGHGVYWSTAHDATAFANQVENVYLEGSLHYDGYDIDDLTSVTISFTSSCVLGAGTYVQFGTPALPADVVVTGNALVDGAAVRSANFALPVPSYKAAVSDLDTVDEVADVTDGLANLAISYTAQISDKA